MRVLRISYDEDPTVKAFAGGGRNVKELLDKFSHRSLFTDLFTRNISLERHLESKEAVRNRIDKIIEQNALIDTDEKLLTLYLEVCKARTGEKIPREKLITYEMIQYNLFTRVFRVPYFPDAESKSIYIDLFDLPTLFAKKVRDFFICFVNPDWSYVPPKKHIPEKMKHVDQGDISTIYRVTHDIVHTHHFRSLEAAYLVLSECDQYRNVPWIHTPHLLTIKDCEGKEEEFYKRLIDFIDVSELIFGGYAYYFTAPFLKQPEHKVIRKFREYFLKEEKYFRFVDHFIARSEEEKSVLVSYYKVPKNRVSVVTGGVNLGEWQGVSKNGPGKDEDIIIISTSRINKQKNLESSIEITKILRDKGFKVRFTNFGQEDDPDYARALIREIENYNLSDKFFLAEYLSDKELFREYEKAHFFVHPSNYESFGLSILEAMAFGTPAVVTNKGGPNEFVSNGKDGFLVDPACPEKYADIIISLINNRSQYREVSKNAMNKANELTWDNYAEKNLDVYERVLYKFRRRKKIPPEPLYGFDANLRIVKAR
jgi:glycosyltransferase involved in cell wall biosynthesis